MRYIVTARVWDDELKEKFGDIGACVILTDAEVVEAIMSFGRASITFGDSESLRTINFENDYD